MNSIWFPVILSLLAAFTYLWHSVSSQEEAIKSEGHIKPKTRYASFALVFAVFLTIPLGYWSLGNLDKQKSWLEAQDKFTQIVQGDNLSKDENEIQELVLALRTSIDSDPNNGYLWFLLAESYFQLRMIDLADASMTRALRIEVRPDWLVANAQILSARSSDSDMASAIKLLSQALSIQPNHQSALLTLGFVYLRQQQYELAIKYWGKLKKHLESSGNDTTRIQTQIEFAEKKLSESKPQ